MDLRQLERESIRAFVQSSADDGYLSGRVLDYGCGKQPYRDIVEAAGGQYEGFDRSFLPANVSGEDIGGEWSWQRSGSFDAMLCTQVVQYVPDPARWLGEFYVLPTGEKIIRDGGHLVLTYPTNWPEVEAEDLHRFTKAGMERLLTEAGFEIVRHERRAEVVCQPNYKFSETFALGYGVICRA